MTIIKVDQNSEEWLHMRRGLYTGSKADKLRPLKRGGEPEYIWTLLAEMVSDDDPDTDGEARERGHTLERENAEIAVELLGLDNPDYAPGMWISDIDGLSISPDCCEASDAPTWAIECKSLSTAKHIKAIVEGADAPPIDGIPQDYRYQALQYFIVNPSLETLYFSMYDPRVTKPLYQHVVFSIKRAEIAKEIDDMTKYEINMIERIKRLAAKINGGVAGA